MKKILTVIFFTLPLMLWAQSITVTGTVKDAGTGEVLAGANVVVEGTSMGAATDASGSFTINNVPTGSKVTASMIGYGSQTLSAGANLNFSLGREAVEMTGLEVLASRADEKTPVAYTNVSKADMAVRLGSQDIPMALNTTPSVYATQQGGGAGDARINVRGFNQRNVAVMINGVPQNDMENGWVYWSNWDGVGDATSSIQMQRGLSAVNLTTPSIGGTMNIITDPTAYSRGGGFKTEIGAGGFLKATVNYNTGLINDNMAFSTTIVRKTGKGIIDKTWTDAWAYYLGGSYQMNETNRFEVYAIGAPQRHGQNLYKQNASAYSQSFAKDELGYSQEALDAFSEATHGEGGRLYNENWNVVDPSYTGKQYWYMYGARTVDRHDPNFLNERENFFHKPLVNLNHYLTLNDQMRLSTIVYWSGGSGGGTGTIENDGAAFDSTTMSWVPNTGSGGYIWDYSGPSRVADWNATMAVNQGTEDRKGRPKTAGESLGILRNSINRQGTLGVISKLNYDMSDALKLQVGLDWRSAKIEHAREVRDLLGGNYFINYNDANHPNGVQTGLGGIIDYHNNTTVDWAGFFGQGNYTVGAISAYGMAGFSTIQYSYKNEFTVTKPLIESDKISTMQFKGGAMYDIRDGLSAFANFGLVEKPPIMDNVIDEDGHQAKNITNEKFQSIEAGVNYRSGNMAVKANFYMTDWKDRNLTKALTTGQGSSGDTEIIYLTGVNQSHSGLEVEGSMQVHEMVRLNAALSMGTWKFVSDASGTLKDEGNNVLGEYSYSLKDLFVGDMPQTSYALGVTVTPMPELSILTLFNMYDKNYADWSPDSREIEDGAAADRGQVWMAPSYSKIDLHVNYDLPVSLGNTRMSAFLHVFNALDAMYVQDAYDNSSYNSFNDDGDHDASSAEVFLGTPRYFNLGLKVHF
ncbi:MAG: TonB-dependent receptor [Candidatus Neomarinimicrobiota bacterium]|nr:TonB-dependent receptor [Candidatus Neomarinimicrobiota bacterium]